MSFSNKFKVFKKLFKQQKHWLHTSNGMLLHPIFLFSSSFIVDSNNIIHNERTYVEVLQNYINEIILKP
jgi:hypothetical protein